MNSRETGIIDLPQEVLQVIFSISISDDHMAAFTLRLVAHSFFDVVEKSTQALSQAYLGPYQTQLTKYLLSHSYAGLFGQILKTEKAHLALTRYSNGVDLDCIVVTDNDSKLPIELDFFIISAVNSRSFHELHALLEEIRLSRCEYISYSRVKESIILQALMSYNEREFLRLTTFTPLDLNDEIGYLHEGRYEQLPLIFHAARFGNVSLVKYLVENDVIYDEDLVKYLADNLAKNPGHYHWQTIHIYLLERMSPQTEPPDWPGPL